MSNNSGLNPDGYVSERISRRTVFLGVGALALAPSITSALAAAENVVRRLYKSADRTARDFWQDGWSHP